MDAVEAVVADAVLPENSTPSELWTKIPLGTPSPVLRLPWTRLSLKRRSPPAESSTMIPRLLPKASLRSTRSTPLPVVLIPPT